MIDTENKKMENWDLRKSLPQETVDISEKRRSNLFMWRGQFSPQLIEALIKSYAKTGDVVFDPFLGSGTVLYEASLFGLDAFGTEINPAAFGLASIYKLINHSSEERNEVIELIDDIIHDYLPLNDLFNHSEGKPLSDLQNELVKLYSEQNGSIAGIILNNLIIGLDFGQKNLTHERLQKSWFGLKSKIQNLPFSQNKIDLFLADARKTALSDDSVDLVITSPPYINVFNYHQNYRKSVESTGFDVLKVAKSEIGSNRKFRSNRYLTVVQFSIDIFLVFQELKRICKNSSKIIFIVGRESSVRKTPFPNAKILTDIATLLGFNLEGDQTRKFSNKFGRTIYEEILRFSISQNGNNPTIEDAREVAVKYLKNALQYAPDESMSDLKSAIYSYQTVKPSKIFDTTI